MTPPDLSVEVKYVFGIRITDANHQPWIPVISSVETECAVVILESRKDKHLEELIKKDWESYNIERYNTIADLLLAGF